MAQVWSDAGIKAALDLYLRTAGAGLDAFEVALFKTNIVPDHTTLLATLLAAEAAFPGYARAVLSYANWPASVVTAHVAASTYGLLLSWTCTGGGATESEYGWFIVDHANTKYIAADTFAAGPYVMLNNGDTIAGNITMTSQSHN